MSMLLSIALLAPLAPLQKNQFDMRIISREGLPYEARQYVVGKLGYLTESGGELFGIDAQGVVRSKGNVSVSERAQKIRAIYPAPKGDIYVVSQELEPRTDYEQFEPNQQLVVTRLSADLKKKWQFTRTLPQVSDLYGCVAGVDDKGAVTVAVGVPQKAFRINPNGKLDWEANLPIKNAVSGLHFDKAGTAHLAMTPTIFEGDGQPIHRISMVTISPKGDVSAAKKLGENFVEMRGRKQVGRYLYINLQADNDFRFACVDLQNDKIQWQRSLGASVSNTEVLFAGNDKGEAALEYKTVSGRTLSGYRNDGTTRFDVIRQEPAQKLKFTSKGLAAIYGRETEGVRETRLDLLNGYGKVTEAYGIAGTGGMPELAEIGNTFLISNINVQQSTENLRSRVTRAMPILWLLLPNK